MADDPTTPARHLREAAMLILARRGWQTSPNDRIEIITLRHAFRVDVLGEENGRPVCHATFAEETPKAAVDLAGAIHHALGWPIIIPPLVLSECGR